MDRQSLYKTGTVILLAAMGVFCLTACSGLPGKLGEIAKQEDLTEKSQTYQRVTVTLTEEELRSAESEDPEPTPAESETAEAVAETASAEPGAAEANPQPVSKEAEAAEAAGGSRAGAAGRDGRGSIKQRICSVSKRQ